MMFFSGRYYFSGTLVSANVLFNDIQPPIERVSSVADIDVGTGHPSMCETPVLSSHSLHAHILNIRPRWGKQYLNESGVS